MNKQRMIWMAGGALLLVVLLFIGQQLLTGMSAAAPLTEEEAKNIVNDRYPGSEIKSISEHKTGYTIEFEIVLGIYEMKVNNDSGEIESIVILENTAEKQKDSTSEETGSDNKEEKKSEKEITEIVQKETDGEIESVKIVENQNKSVYEAKVKEKDAIVTFILEPASGEILSTSKDEIKTEEKTVPLTEQQAIDIAVSEVPGEVDDVELEQSEDGLYFLIEIETSNDQEATVQVNAISGKIMSTTWDD